MKILKNTNLYAIPLRSLLDTHEVRVVPNVPVKQILEDTEWPTMDLAQYMQIMGWCIGVCHEEEFQQF